MTENDLILEYLSFLNKKDNAELNGFYGKIVTFYDEHFIPAVSFDVANFLYVITHLVKPKNILEIGFGAGASTLFIHNAMDKSSKLTTLERDHNRVNRGRLLLKELNISDINLIHIDAFIYLKDNIEMYDLIFLDAVKKDYKNYLPEIKKCLTQGGVLIADNIFFNKRVIAENVEKKYLNGVASIKEFNENLAADKDFTTIFLNTGDGLSLSVRK